MCRIAQYVSYRGSGEWLQVTKAGKGTGTDEKGRGRSTVESEPFLLHRKCVWGVGGLARCLRGSVVMNGHCLHAYEKPTQQSHVSTSSQL